MTDTNETKAVTPYENWISLNAAAKKLGYSRRTLERYIQLGAIEARPGKPDGSRQLTRMVDPKAVTELKHQIKIGNGLDWKNYRSSRKKNPTELVPRQPASTVAVSTQLEPLNLISSDPWLTVDEAGSYSRLPAAYLRQCVATGELPARNVRNSTSFHSWRIKRSALDALDPSETARRAPIEDRDVALGIIGGD